MADDCVFPVDIEDEFLSCEKDYCGPDPDQTRQIIDTLSHILTLAVMKTRGPVNLSRARVHISLLVSQLSHQIKHLKKRTGKSKFVNHVAANWG